MSRSARFFIIAGLVGWKGGEIKPAVEKIFQLVLACFCDTLDWRLFCDKMAALIVGNWLLVIGDW